MGRLMRRLACAIIGHRIAYKQRAEPGLIVHLGTPFMRAVLATQCTRCGLEATRRPRSPAPATALRNENEKAVDRLGLSIGKQFANHDNNTNT